MRKGIIYFVLFCFMLVAINYGVTKYSEEDIVIKVENKERIGVRTTDGKASFKYLVYAEDETFENTDTIWYLKYDSSDLQNDLKEGHRYHVTVTGFRIPFLSWHRNIIRINN